MVDIVYFGLSHSENGLKLFDVYFDITNINFLGKSEGYSYYWTSKFNLRISDKNDIHEITILDTQKLNFIGKEICSLIVGKGKFKDGLMFGEWIFELRNDKNIIICEIKGNYDNRGLKTGKWTLVYNRRINFFSLREDLFHGEVTIYSNDLKFTQIYDRGRKAHEIISSRK